jgi:hypothetical protein
MVTITYQDGTQRTLQFPIVLAELREAMRSSSSKSRIEAVQHLSVVRNRTAGLLYLLEMVTEQLEAEKKTT